MRRALLPLIVLLAIAPNASAKQWCVSPASGCTDGNAGTLQSALDMAKNNAGPDQIRLGVATYSGPFTYDDNGSSTNSVALTGVNSRATTLTRSSSGTILYMNGVGAAHNSVANLRFHITTNNSQGLSAGVSDVLRVAVSGDGTITGSTGLVVASGTLQGVHVGMPLSGGNQGVSTLGDLIDSTIAADTGVSSNGTVQRSDITGGSVGLETSNGKFDDDIVHIGGSATERVGLDARNSGFASGSAVARHLTILGDGNPGSIGVRVHADAMNFDESQSLDVRNTIIRGVAHGFRREGSTGIDTGTANLSMHYTDYDPATREESGPGTGPNVSDPTNPNTDPMFVDPAHGDFRLAYSSPLIDKGDPAALAADEPNTDFAGRARVVNGRRDIGALEYQRQAPVITSASANPVGAQTGVPFTFTASATDADADPVTYSWTFDDGGSATGQTVQHAFAAQGIHVATVTASDPLGRTASVGVAVGVLPDPKSILSALSLSPKKFRAGSGKKKGTTVKFTLKVPTQVTFAVRRNTKGHKLLGTFMRKGVLGKNKFRWAGRVGGKKLKPGKYRLIGTVGSGPNASVRRVNFTVKH